MLLWFSAGRWVPSNSFFLAHKRSQNRCLAWVPCPSGWHSALMFFRWEQNVGICLQMCQAAVQERFCTDIMQHHSCTTRTLLHFSQKRLELKVENRFLCSLSGRGEAEERAQKTLFALFHHPLPVSSRTNHFSAVASACLAIVHPNYHFCWDGMNNSVGILLFSLTTDSTQRTGLDEKSNSEAAAARWTPPFVSVSHFLLIKKVKIPFPYLSRVWWKQIHSKTARLPSEWLHWMLSPKG